MSDVRLSEKIGPAFYSVARDVFQHGHTHYDESGGRGSLKSSFVSIIVPTLLMQEENKNCHALVLRKVANTLCAVCLGNWRTRRGGILGSEGFPDGADL